MLRVILSVFVLLIFSVPVLGWWLAQRGLPSYDGIQVTPSLGKEVAIVYDDRGLPSIEASVEDDLYRAQGYWCASRRLFQMDMLRRIARGELSEVFGAGCLPQDKMMRQLGIGRVVKDQAKLLSAEAKQALEAYCAGVNSYIKENQGSRSLEFTVLGYDPRPWTAEDSLAVSKYLDYQMEESWSLDDLRQRVLDRVGPEVASSLFEEKFKQPAPQKIEEERSAGSGKPEVSALPEELSSVSLGFAAKGQLVSRPGVGSNGWVIKGSASDTGGSLMALDRHGQFSDPNLWYGATLSTADFRVSGIASVGVPGITFGRNSHIAWGATAFKADTQDLYIEEFSPQFPNKYKTPDGWAAAREEVEEIACKSGFRIDHFRHKVMITRHGPVLLASGSKAVALCWSGLDITTPSIETTYRLNHVRNWQEFREALKDYSGAPQTFLFADDTGNIGMQVAGNIPVRKESELTARLSAGTLLPGWVDRHDWSGRLDFAEMQSLSNPPEGFAIANLATVSGVRPLASPYPGLRLKVLAQASKTSGRRPGLPDMADWQRDQYAPLAQLVKETLSSSVNKKEVIDALQLRSLELLDQWDGYLRTQSASASVYEAFVRTVARRCLSAKLGDQLTREYLKRWPRVTVLVESILKNKGEGWLPPEERTFETFVVTSFAQALKEIRLASGSDTADGWSWGALHKARFDHIFFQGARDLEPVLGGIVNIEPVEVGGDQDTVNTLNVTLSEKPGIPSFLADTGPTEYLLIDMSDADRFYETQPLGQSGHLLSPYRKDQLKSWMLVKPLPVAFSDSQIAKQQAHKQILAPE